MVKKGSTNIIKNNIILNIESTKMQYEYHTTRVAQIQQEIDNIFFKKLNKKKIDVLKKEIKKEQKQADKWFNAYYEECKNLSNYYN